MNVLRRRLRGELCSDLVAALAMLAIVAVAVTLVMRLWRADLDVPFLYFSDGNLFLMLVKGVLTHGWYPSNPDLGAPFGQDNQDFPTVSGDTLQLLIVKFIGIFTGNVATVMNLYFLLGFALTGLAAFAVFRILGVSRAPAVVCSALFTLLPLHFVVGEAQPFNGAYWMIPLACYLALAVLEDRPLLTRAERPRNRALAFASRRTLLTLALCVVIGSSSNYHASYAALLIAVVALLALLRTRSLRTLVTGIVVSLAIVATVGLNALPTITYRHEHGSNPIVAQRRAGENELYALSIAAMVLPIEGHRVPPLARLRDRYNSETPLPTAADGPALGVVATAGFLWLLGLGLALVIGAIRSPQRWGMHANAAAATLVSVLIAVTGGFSIIFALLISPQLRVWERYYLFIAFFSLLAVALLLEAAARRFGGARRPYLVPAALAGVLVLGVLDGTSNSNIEYVPDYSGVEARYRSDAELVAAIERRLPPDAGVFQLPYVGYPEAPIPGHTAPYDQARLYLHSDDLRWSYGAMEFRPEDWSAALADKPLGLVLPSVSAAGFAGILVDRAAYEDRAARVERELGRVLRVEPVVSREGRYSFFDMRAYGERLRRTHPATELRTLRPATLRPLRAEPVENLVRYIPTGQVLAGRFQLSGPQATLAIANPGPGARSATLRLQLTGAAPGETAVEVSMPDGSTRLLRSGRSPLLRTLSMRPGATPIALSAVRAPPGVPLILDAEIRDAALTPFLGEARAAPMYPQRIGSFPAAPSATASDLTGTDG